MLRSLKWCCNVSGAMNSLHIHVPGPQQLHRDLPVVFMHARGGGGCLLKPTRALALPVGTSIVGCLSAAHSPIRDCTRSFLPVSSCSHTWFSITCVGCCVDPSNIASYCLLLLALMAAPSHCITLQHCTPSSEVTHWGMTWQLTLHFRELIKY